MQAVNQGELYFQATSEERRESKRGWLFDQFPECETRSAQVLNPDTMPVSRLLGIDDDVVGILLLPGALPAALQGKAQKALFLLGACCAVLILCALLLYRPLLGGRSVRFRRRLARLRHALRSVSGAPHVLLAAWLLGTAIQTTFLMLTAKLAESCGLFLPLRDWFFAWPLAKLAAVLPLTQGGIGIREAALVGLLSPFGAAPHLVLAAGLVWEAVVITGGLVSGLIAFLLGRKESARPSH